ncbi:MAG: hypothetical protein M1834_004962 [Cirrosporium novae-zelandiae]|nr:MAG: hypothetical protein M1834_004962 [Cirrosporium novae-zelandiae]
MDSYDYRDTAVKSEASRYGRDDDQYARAPDSYRRRSPGKRPFLPPRPLRMPSNLSTNNYSSDLNGSSRKISFNNFRTPFTPPKTSRPLLCSPSTQLFSDLHAYESLLVPVDRRSGRAPRARSRSPVSIDRYQPSDRLPRGDDYYSGSHEHTSRDREDRRRAPSPANIDRYVPGQEPAQPVVRTNPMPNPLTLDFQVGFNFFAEWWRIDRSIKEDKDRAKHGGRRPSDRVKGERESREEREKERAQIQVAYDAYKEELQIKMAKQFVQQHKGEEWFKERYVPEIRDVFRRRISEFRLINYQNWEHELNNGTFDEYTLEGIYRSESDGAGGLLEKEEGETTAVAEVLGVGDLVPAKGGELRDEAIAQPALLIKTLAPNVSRSKIEEFCKEHLGEQEGGFKWLSLSDPNPTKKYHRIGWIILHPGPEPMQEIERGDGRDEEGEEVENGDAKETVQSTPEKALELINGKTIVDPERGDFTCHVGVHVPPNQLRKKALWDLFSSPERVERDLELARRVVSKFDQEFGAGIDAVARIEERVEDLRGKGWLQPPPSGPVKIKKDRNEFELNEDEVLLDAGEEEEEGAYDEEADDEELLVKKKKLDLLVEYLRRVFHFCFFCVFESDSAHELVRKCPGGHLRRPRSGLSTSAKAAARASALGQPFPFKKKDISGDDATETGSVTASSPVEDKKFNRGNSKNEQQLLRAFNWVKTYEDKLLQILEPENVDLKKIGGKPIDEAMEDELGKYVKQEDESKFRCKVPDCTKLFKAQHFWRKHIEKRHAEWFEGVKKEVELVNIYVMDPAHIAPSRSDANSNGHFPTNNHMPSGTPRGFNLASMPFNFGGMPAGFPMAAGFPTFMANSVTTQAGWNGGAVTAADGGVHQAGAMRRGTGRYNNRPGPYDRRTPRGGYSTGRPDSSGRLMNPSSAKWLDGAGAQAVGPREATQGRSLKSYEDLDAVGGSGSGELNY